jgi:hypothetical protein
LIRVDNVSKFYRIYELFRAVEGDFAARAAQISPRFLGVAGSQFGGQSGRDRRHHRAQRRGHTIRCAEVAALNGAVRLGASARRESEHRALLERAKFNGVEVRRCGGPRDSREAHRLCLLRNAHAAHQFSETRCVANGVPDRLVLVKDADFVCREAAFE